VFVSVFGQFSYKLANFIRLNEKGELLLVAKKIYSVFRFYLAA
jgi:hypothetical protein